MWYGKAGSRAGAVVHMRGQRPAGRSPRRVAPVRDGVTGLPAGTPARRALVSLRLGQLVCRLCGGHWRGEFPPGGGARARVPVVSGPRKQRERKRKRAPFVMSNLWFHLER